MKIKIIIKLINVHFFILIMGYPMKYSLYEKSNIRCYQLNIGCYQDPLNLPISKGDSTSELSNYLIIIYIILISTKTK